ncbi:MAG: hypothetical protein AAFS10_03805 [Myxococcota bacterium]
MTKHKGWGPEHTSLRDDLDFLEQELLRERTQPRREWGMWFIWVVVALFGLVLVLGLLFEREIRAYMRSEIDLWGRPTIALRAEEKIGDVDVARVHRELLSDWTIAMANVPRWGQQPEQEAWQALHDAIKADANLLTIAQEIRTKALSDPVEHGERLLFLTKAWTRYLDANGSGYVVRSNVMVTASSQTFYTMIYDTRERLVADVGGTTYPARVLERVDQTNIRESYLGATSPGDREAVVIVDRLLDFAMKRVWPSMDPDQDATRDPLSLVWGAAMRDEAAQSLSDADLKVLRQTAGTRKTMLDAVDAIHGRHSCGSRFVINDLPPQGFGPETLHKLKRYADRAKGRSCPEVTHDEYTALTNAGDQLRDVDGLEQALNALVLWLARPIAVHEARHVADDAQVDGLEAPMDCTVCDEAGMSVSARAELSAYLASFAWSKTPQTAFFQAWEPPRTLSVASHA